MAHLGRHCISAIFFLISGILACKAMRQTKDEKFAQFKQSFYFLLNHLDFELKPPKILSLVNAKKTKQNTSTANLFPPYESS